MYDLEVDNDPQLSDHAASNHTSERAWRLWAAKETQLRALLGHYILDGQISEYTGGPTCQRHTSHSLPMPTEGFVFESLDPSTWMERMHARKQRSTPFTTLFSLIFSYHVHVRHLGTSLSPFTASVALEGLKSLIAERTQPGLKVVGVPSELDVSRALGRFYVFVEQSSNMSESAKKLVLLRWHTICLDGAVDLTWLGRNLCRKFGIEQRITAGRTMPPLDLQSWIGTPRARHAFLHATSIHRMLQEIPMLQAQMSHVPIAIYSAGIVYCAFLLGGAATIAVPDNFRWESVVSLDKDLPSTVLDDDLDADVLRYLRGDFEDGHRSKNILYDINLFGTLLQSLSQVWGVCAPIYRVLEQLSWLYT